MFVFLSIDFSVMSHMFILLSQTIFAVLAFLLANRILFNTNSYCIEMTTQFLLKIVRDFF